MALSLHYAVLMLAVLAIVAAAVLLAVRRAGLRMPCRRLSIVVVLLLAATAIFDPLIIAAGLVDYDYSRTLGLRLFGAPVEDFAYALAAAVLMPVLWERLGRRAVAAAGAPKARREPS